MYSQNQQEFCFFFNNFNKTPCFFIEQDLNIFLYCLCHEKGEQMDSAKLNTELKPELQTNQNNNGNNGIIEKSVQENNAVNGIVKEIKKEENLLDYKPINLKKQKKQDNFLNILKLIAPGTVLREAIDDIIRASNGALIVLDDTGLGKMMDGGFKVNSRLTSQKLVELSKMDGAIIISKDTSKIICANTMLYPDQNIPTLETGTRHKAAERTARQLATLVIAISERRKIATLYHGDIRYPVKGTQELLRKAIDSLQFLEKQAESFNDLLLRFNTSEFIRLLTLNDVCLLLQRTETMIKLNSIIKRLIIELGKESSLIKMRLRELMKDIEKEELAVIADFSRLKVQRTKNILSSLSIEELLDIENILIALGYSDKDVTVVSKGYRIMIKAGLTDREIKLLIQDFQNLNNILDAQFDQINEILKDKKKTKFLQDKLVHMKEQVILGKKI